VLNIFAMSFFYLNNKPSGTDAGVDLFLIARLLGHSVQKTTELYAHLHPNY